jgi:hypothetical protein
MMDHIMETTAAAFKGTSHEDDWLVYHDALSSWWGKKDQAHAVKIGLAQRQIRAWGDCNKGTRCAQRATRIWRCTRPACLLVVAARRYHQGLVGDSPELCVGLDAHGFADLDDALKFNCALSSSFHEVGDVQRFGLGTPKEIASSMRRVWEIAPSSARIVEDFEALPRVLEAIIKAKGCVVPDLFLRSGRRVHRIDGKKGEFCETKVRSKQRKGTLTVKPVHPDNQAAYDAFRKGERDRARAVELLVENFSDPYLNENN